MRKISKTTATLTLTAAMAASLLTACSSQEAGGTGSSSAGGTSHSTVSQPADSNQSSSSPAQRMDITFSAIDYYAGSSNTGEYSEEILNQVNDYLGHNLKLQWIASDVLDEKNNLALANPSTMPMIMTFNSNVTGSVVSAAKAGAFVDLNQYIWDSGKYPNLSQANQNVCDSLTVDGKLIGIYRARPIGRYGMSYRADWAEKLGMDTPETIEDVYEMMHAFTYDDPDGNGKNDTFGMEMTSYTGPLDIMQTWFGVGNGWAESDGQLIPIHMQPEYKEALDFFKKLYDEGIMASDWAVRTTDTWGNGCKNGEAGMFIDTIDGGRSIWDYFIANNIPSAADHTQPASMNLVGTINGRTLATTGYNGFFTLSASTCDTEEKIEAALTVLDRMCDNEMIILGTYGLEGINYKIDENGYLVDTDEEDNTLKLNYKGLFQLMAYIPNIEATSPTLEKTDRMKLEESIKASNEDHVIYNPAAKYLVNSATYSEVGAALDDIIKQARTQYICGQIDEGGLEEAWQSWLDQGGQKIIEEVNSQKGK